MDTRQDRSDLSYEGFLGRLFFFGSLREIFEAAYKGFRVHRVEGLGFRV